MSWRKLENTRNMVLSCNTFRCLFVFVVIVLFDLTNEEHECGRPLGNEFRLEEDRIVAGYDIGYYRYPWYAALTRYNAVSCGATLVGPKTVVSAAHCYKEFLDLASKGVLTLEQVFIVKLGVYNICTTEKTAKDYTVQKVHIHHLYQTKKPYYDISLITLSSETNAYTPICLPPPHMKKKPLDGTVPGLGTLRYHGAMPCTVHEARLLIHNSSECFKMINSTGNNPSLIHNAFCAGYIQGGVDTCQGDSGGPLQSMNEFGNYALIGIVSFGFRCAMPGLLGMYTDVSEFVDWIQEKSGLEHGVLQTVPQKKPTTGVVNSVGGNDSNLSNGKTPRPGHHHHTKPYRRPIKIIIYKDNNWTVMTKYVLHHPIVRNKKTFN